MACSPSRTEPKEKRMSDEPVASAIAWQLDSEQSWVTGQILGVDGALGSARTMPRA